MVPSSRREGKADARLAQTWVERAKTFAVRLGLTLAVVTLICSWFVILRNHVASLDCYQVEKSTLVPKYLPNWAGEGVSAELSELPDLPERFSIMSPGVCDRVARAFENNPWVDEVISVRKIYPNRINVRLRFRRPVAGVLFGRRYYLVDGEGRRLSPGLTQWPDGTDSLPIVVNSARELPEKGEIWSDEDVQAAAAVARTLLANRDDIRTRFRKINVCVDRRGSRREGPILLLTHQGTKVRWGRSPLLENSPGELTPAEKIGKMIRFEQKRGPLSSYEYVDVRFENVHYGRRVRLLSNRGVRH